MFMIGTNKQYDGIVTEDKYTPEKPHDIRKFLNQ